MNNPMIRHFEDGVPTIVFPDLKFSLHLSVTAFNSENSFSCDRLVQVKCAHPEGIAHLREALRFENEREALELLFFDNVPGFAYRRLILPTSAPRHLLSLDETIEFPPDSLWRDPDAIDTFHAENVRLYQRFVISLTADRTKPAAAAFDSDEEISGAIWAGAGNLRPEIGRSPFLPFPAMIYTLRGSDLILLDGVLSQERFNRCYGFSGGRIIFRQVPKSVKHLVAGGGEIIAGEWNYIEVARSRDLCHPYDHFFAALKNFGGSYRGEREEVHRQMIWGSWNDGIFREINQADLLRTADVLREFFPAVKWLQVDDGYDDWDYQRHPRGRIGVGVAYPGERVSPEKFPDGMRRFTDEVRKRGLRPALWVGLSVSTLRRWYLEHPEHFVLYRQTPYFAFPDISQEPVREFLRKAFRMFIEEWGFEAIKLDFWSYFFEDEQVVIPAGGITGYEYRRWFLEMLRELLPEDGYLQIGCDIAMANVHLGKYVDNYRYGIDIGGGEWNNVLTNARWAAFCLNTHSGGFFIPNSDSIGFFPGLTATEAQTAINFCLATRSCVEIAGWLHKNLQHPLLPFLRKCCCAPDNGADIFFGDFNFKETDSAPLLWYFKGPHFSHDRGNPVLPEVTAGIFNWSDEASKVVLTAKMFSLAADSRYWLKDFWSDEVLGLAPEAPLVVSLPPHGSRLFGIAEVRPGLAVLDADSQLNAVRMDNDVLYFDSPDRGEAELFLTGRPREIRSRKKAVAFQVEACGPCCRIRIAASDSPSR